jgi:predicted dinucleotide-binding enzyme
MRKVGILGSAVVGQALAQGFRKHGYEVRIGSRTPAKLVSFTESSGVPAGTFETVAGWGELLVLAVHGTAAEEALNLAGAANHQGKIVIDTTNPLSLDSPVDGVVQVFTGSNSSLLERLQAAFPDTRLVKAFNSVGSARMVNPVYAGGRPTMFFCGN